MASWLLDHDDPVVASVKNCVAVEYVPVSEYAEEATMNVLINHGDSFEWMDISMAIPVGSEREYPPPGSDKPKIAKLPTRE